MNAMLPSRQSLAREYSVDLSTVQRAVSEMLTDGTLRADSGRGTFVARDLTLEATIHDDTEPTFAGASNNYESETGSLQIGRAHV